MTGDPGTTMFRSLAGRVAATMQQLNDYLTMTPGSAYLQIQYQSALTGKNEPFPAGTVVKVDYIDKAGKKSEHPEPLKIEGDAGKITFQMKVRDRLSIWLDFSERPYLNVTDKSYMTKQEFDQALTGDPLYLTRKAVMLLPDRIDLKNCPWEIKSDLFNDAADQCLFEGLDTKELKGDSEFLPVVVAPEWTHVSFRFHDRLSYDEAQVPEGLWVEGFNEAVSEDKPVTGSSLFKDKNVLIPWFLTRDQSTDRDEMKVSLSFTTRNLFMQDGKIVEEDPDEVWKLPLLDRLKYFDLPAHLQSDDWQVEFDSDWDFFHNVINELTAADNPIVFYLDGVVLTDDKFRSYAWDDDNRFAAMNMQMQVINPDPDRPFWTTGKTFSNFIGPDVVDKPVRLVALDGIFYNVSHHRVKKGSAVGARAALQLDPDIHAGEALHEPLVKDAGNFELHFLRECLDADNKETCCLAVYWSARITPDAGTDPEPVFADGFLNARTRWELKKYTFQPQKDPSDKKIKVTPVFYFEGRESNPAHCNVALHPASDARADMGLYSANFIEGNESPSGNSVTEDGVSYQWLTMSHELGHAFGLEDEYCEPIEDSWNPVLPAYDQYYPGMPFSIDSASMMNSNQAPRLRHMWHLCDWMNNHADVKKLTGETVFHVRSGRGPTYKYYRDAGIESYLQPAYKEEGHVNGTFGKMDLFLYRLGEDETTAIVVPGKKDFNGILIVAPKLAFRFQAKPPASWGPKANSVAYMQQFQNRMGSFNRKLYLESADDKEFSKIYVHIMPHYHYLDSSSAHVTFVVRKHSSSEPYQVPSYHTKDFTGSQVIVDEGENNKAMLRYVLGMKPYKEVASPDGKSTVKQPVSTISLSEMKFLADWVKLKRSHDFTVKV